LPAFSAGARPAPRARSAADDDRSHRVRERDAIPARLVRACVRVVLWARACCA